MFNVDMICFSFHKYVEYKVYYTMFTTIYQRKNDWKRAVNETHNDFYDYSSVDYINANIKVTIICPKHGKFQQTPHDHKNKRHGCARCFGNAKLTNKDIDEKIITTKKPIRRIGDVQNAMTNLKWLCLDDKCGGTWNAAPDNVLNKNTGCPYCKIGYISNHYGILYFVKIVDNETKYEFLKIGITKKEIHDRFSGKRFRVTKEIFIKSLPLSEAYGIEQEIINSMKEYAYLAPMSFGGRTECFINSTLVEEHIAVLLK